MPLSMKNTSPVTFGGGGLGQNIQKQNITHKDDLGLYSKISDKNNHVL